MMTADNLRLMDVFSLKAVLSGYELPTSGSKPVLLKRLLDHVNKDFVMPPAPPPSDTAAGPVSLPVSSTPTPAAGAAAEAVAGAGVAPKSLKDEHFDRLEAVWKREKGLGAMLVQGVAKDEEEEEDEEEEDKEEDYTAEQLTELRHIVITKKRESALKKAMAFVTIGQSEEDGGCMMFNTRSGNQVIRGIPKELMKAMNMKTGKARFDALFALTYALKEYDYWMHDNEMWGRDGELDDAIVQLGLMWKHLLACSNEELGIDPEFTRAGVECLLSQFRDTCDECEAVESAFRWDPNSASESEDEEENDSEEDDDDDDDDDDDEIEQEK
jgi:hypothetical protein